MRAAILRVSAIVVAAIGGAALLTLALPRKPTFQGRSLKVSNKPLWGTALRSSEKLRSLATPVSWKIRRDHSKMASRVLLIRNPDVLNSDAFRSEPGSSAARGPWSFEGVCRTAFEMKSASNGDRTEEFLKTWIEGGDYPLQPFAAIWRNTGFSLSTVPLRTLAVVSRLDLAHVEPRGLAGAEFRFIFGAIPRSPSASPFSAIVEFVMPPLSKHDFRDLARNWEGLMDLQGDAYQRRLSDLLSASVPHAKSVRLRVNAMTGENTEWSFAQYEYTADGLSRGDLDQQPRLEPFESETCQTGQSQVGRFASAHLIDVLAFQHRFFGTGLAARESTAISAVRNVLTLGPAIVPDESRELARRSLSISSCVGCHSRETGNNKEKALQFSHVEFREPQKASGLSRFLTGDGSEPGIAPYLVDPPQTRCDGDQQRPHATYSFNDLLRRHAFLRTVLDDLKDDDTDEVWRERLEKAGLSVFQVH